jgi:carbon monoxide dehydrogenase subunit G
MKWVLRIAGGVVAVLTLGFIVLFALSRRADAGRSVSTIEIAASPEQIWPWINDGAKLKQWISWTEEVRVPSDSPQSGLGMKRVYVMRDPNEANARMNIDILTTKYEAPAYQELAMSTPGAFEGTESYRLTPLANHRTRVEIDGKFHYSIFFAQLMEPLITPAATKKLEDDMGHLKKLVESEAISAAK